MWSPSDTPTASKKGTPPLPYPRKGSLVCGVHQSCSGWFRVPSFPAQRSIVRQPADILSWQRKRVSRRPRSSEGAQTLMGDKPNENKVHEILWIDVIHVKNSLNHSCLLQLFPTWGLQDQTEGSLEHMKETTGTCLQHIFSPHSMHISFTLFCLWGSKGFAVRWFQVNHRPQQGFYFIGHTLFYRSSLWWSYML